MTEDDEQRYRLPRSVIPRRYGLVLEPDLVAGSIVGTEDIAVAVLEPVTEIVMNAVDLEIAADPSRRETGAGRDLGGSARHGHRARTSDPRRGSSSWQLDAAHRLHAAS